MMTEHDVRVHVDALDALSRALADVNAAEGADAPKYEDGVSAVEHMTRMVVHTAFDLRAALKSYRELPAGDVPPRPFQRNPPNVIHIPPTAPGVSNADV